jgi:hypothetical protein
MGGLGAGAGCSSVAVFPAPKCIRVNAVVVDCSESERRSARCTKDTTCTSGGANVGSEWATRSRGDQVRSSCSSDPCTCLAVGWVSVNEEAWAAAWGVNGGVGADGISGPASCASPGGGGVGDAASSSAGQGVVLSCRTRWLGRVRVFHDLTCLE